MLLFEVERGPETSGTFSAGALVNTLAFESEHELVADSGRLTGEGEIGPQAASLGNAFWVLGFELVQAILEVGTRPRSDLIQFVFLDNFVLGSGQLGTDRVSKERVKLTITLLNSGVMIVVEATRKHFLGECNKVRRSSQVPVFVAPEFAGRADACLYLVDDKVDTKLEGQVSHALSKLIGEVIVTTFRLDWLHDNRNNLFSVAVFPLTDFGSNVSQASLVLGTIILDVVGQRIFVSRVLSCRPVECRDVNFVHVLCARSGERAQQTPMEALSEGENGEFR